MHINWETETIHTIGNNEFCSELLQINLSRYLVINRCVAPLSANY
jgi:hypothetical protein